MPGAHPEAPSDRPAAPGGWTADGIDLATARVPVGDDEVAELVARALDETVTVPDLPGPDGRSAVDDLADRITEALGPGPDRTGFAIVSVRPGRPLEEPQWSRLYWALGCRMGRPVTQNIKGDYMGHVRMIPDGSALRGYSSRTGGAYHCDFTAVAGLLCLQQGRSGGASTLVSTATVHNILRAEAPELLDIAFAPLPWGRLREHSPGEPGYTTQPIFGWRGDVLSGFYNRALVRQAQEEEEGAPPLTPEQHQLLDAVDEISHRRDIHLDFLLEPGEALFVNNYLVLHGRTTFEDHDDPVRWRHLLRLWLEVPGIEARVAPEVRYDYRFGRTGIPAGDPVPS